MISQKELVSIGMPTYAGGLPFLKRAIDSVLGQTYSNIELIITENPGSDGVHVAQGLCEEYMRKDKRIKYIRHKDDVGAGENYNSALREATGEYFCWVVFDDFIHPFFIEKCVSLLRNDQEAVLAMSDFTFANAKGEAINKCDPEKYFPRERGLYERLKHFTLMLWEDGKATLFHGLWRHSILINNPYRDLPDGDLNFIFRNLSRGPFLFVNEVLFYKGTLPGRESREHEPLTFSRVLTSIGRRITFVPSQLWNTGFILRLKALPLSSRIKLVGWNCVAAARLLTKRRY